MLHLQALDPDALGLLRKLQAQPTLSTLRLVGGTSLALQIGHRKSVDLDLFGNLEATPEELSQILLAIGRTTTLSTSRSIYVYTINDVKVDLVNYPYEWLEASVKGDGIVLAGKPDIAAMKLAAITNRGSKKDFVDLHVLLQEYSLHQMLDWYERKFPDGSEFLVLRSLSYFEDAEEDEDPVMLGPWSWTETKATIQEAVRECQ